MKKLLITFGQFLLFLVVDGVGSLFFQPFHLKTTLSGSAFQSRTFVWDGVLLMLVVYFLVLLIAAVRKRFAMSAPWATLALLLAAAAGYALKLGFITQDQ